MKNQLIQFLAEHGTLVKDGHWRMSVYLKGSNHPQVIDYVIINGVDCFFLSGASLHETGIRHICEELYL